MISTVLIIGLATGITALAAWVVAPRPPVLGPETTGDAELAAAARGAAGALDIRAPGLSVAMVEDGRIRTAGLGGSGDPDRPAIDDRTSFEIGSITKALTGMLLADLAERGHVRLEAPVRELLPDVRFDDPAIASATLEELAGHRSGLPRLPSQAGMVARGFLARISAMNPYGRLTEADVIGAAAAERTDTGEGTGKGEGKGTVAYSNLGMALAGHAAARAAGKPYADLLQERVIGPLGLRDTRVVGPGEAAPGHPATGHKAANGAIAHRWDDTGYAPAGGVWSTSADLARLLDAVMKGTAPGASAAEPRFDAGEGRRIGLGWFTSDKNGQRITWHNGRTGGFSAFAGFDPAAGRVVVVLANSDQPVDAIAQRLLGASPAKAGETTEYISLGLTIVFVIVVVVVAVNARLVRNSLRGRLTKREIVTDAVWPPAYLGLIWWIGSWTTISPLAWVASAALTGACIAYALLQWRDLPAGSGRWWRWTGTALSAAAAAGLLSVMTGLIAFWGPPV